MPKSSPIVPLVNEALAEVFATHRPELARLSGDLAPLAQQLEHFTSGGKRTRPQFIAAGASLVTNSTEVLPHAALVQAAVAVELFHAAALIHDDILDRSDTRRGMPSTHRVFAQLHRERGWIGNREHFGTSAAILAGDLLLMWSDDALLRALREVPAETAARASAEFSRMRTEVTAGQYLDVVEELAWPVTPVDQWADRAIAIATAKSARYSVEAPLRIGVTLAGGDGRQLALASSIGVPLGLAFQVRDDELSVFGDPDVTGKPAGDDLREGKRTLLIAELAARADADTRAFFDTRLGQHDLSADEIARMQRALRDTGALDAVEGRIQAWLNEALTAIREADLPEATAQRLTALAERTARRVA